MNKFPNLFIVGAPKSGTTSLYAWLSQHPDVFMSQNKEPRYFCDFDPNTKNGPLSDLFFEDYVNEYNEYLELFNNALPSVKWLGESSTDYLWDEDSAQKIFENTKSHGEVKIIIILRDPVSRAFSEHSHLIREGVEDLSFIESLKAEDARYQNNWVPLFFHKKRGMYYSQVKKFLDYFGEDSVKIILYDELKHSKNKVFIDLCHYLKIDPVKISDNIIYNKSGKPRSRLLFNLERKNNIFKSIIRTITTEKFRNNLKFRIQSFNLKSIDFTVEDWQYAYNLFKDDIVKTEKLIKKDLSSWKMKD